jgi:hypothetical protein
LMDYTPVNFKLHLDHMASRDGTKRARISSISISHIAYAS